MSNTNRILEINEQIAKLETELFSLVNVPEVTITVSGPAGSGKTTICALILNALEDKIASANNIVFETDPKRSNNDMFRDFNDLVSRIEDYKFQVNRKIRIIESKSDE